MSFKNSRFWTFLENWTEIIKLETNTDYASHSPPFFPTPTNSTQILVRDRAACSAADRDSHLQR